MFKSLHSLFVGMIALALVAIACTPAHASPPADSAHSSIAVAGGVANASLTCTGPASCVLSDIVDSTTHAVVLTGRVLPPAGSVALTMACPSSGGALSWSGTAIGRTTGMTDAVAVPVHFATPPGAGCALAVSPGATVVVTPITVGP